jgi:hypothetical protein
MYLLQLPQGALPLAGSLATTSRSISLPPYGTKQLTSSFYFPEQGTFKSAPVSVTKRGRSEAATVWLQVLTRPVGGGTNCVRDLQYCHGGSARAALVAQCTQCR